MGKSLEASPNADMLEIWSRVAPRVVEPLLPVSVQSLQLGTCQLGFGTGRQRKGRLDQ